MKKEKGKEWEDAKTVQNPQQQQQQRPVRPTDFLDMDSLVFEIGAKHVTEMGYRKMQEKIVQEAQGFKKQYEELKAQKDKVVENSEANEHLQKKVDTLSECVKELRDTERVLRDENKELKRKVDTYKDQEAILYAKDIEIETLREQLKSFSEENEDLYKKVKEYESKSQKSKKKRF